MLGKPVADFSLPSTGGSTSKFSGTRGHTAGLHFTPKNMYRRKVRVIARGARMARDE